MDTGEAADTLAGLQAVRALTRNRVSLFWFPLCAFGLANVLLAPVGLLFGANTLGTAQVIAESLVTAGVCIFYRLRAARTGFRTRPWKLQAAAGLCLLTCTAVGAWLSVKPGDAPPWLVAGLTLGYFAVPMRSLVVAALGLLLAAVALLFITVHPQAGPGTLTGVDGMICLGAGLAWRSRSTA